MRVRTRKILPLALLVFHVILDKGDVSFNERHCCHERLTHEDNKRLVPFCDCGFTTRKMAYPLRSHCISCSRKAPLTHDYGSKSVPRDNLLFSLSLPFTEIVAQQRCRKPESDLRENAPRAITSQNPHADLPGLPYDIGSDGMAQTYSQ